NKSYRGPRVRARKLSGPGKRLFGVGLLGILELRLTEEISEGRIVRRLLKLPLETRDGSRRLAPLEVQVCERLLCLKRSRVASEGLVKKRVGLSPALLLDAQENKLNVADRA